MTKKIISVVMALILVLGIVPVAMAETADDRNYTIKTEFYGYDEAAEEWVPVTTASGGETLKMRGSVSTNYVSGPASFLLAYDKSVISANLPASSAAELEINPDSTFAYYNIQMVRAANGANAAAQQLGLGNITQEEFDKYAFIAGSIITNGCVQYDGSEWLFEIDMTVLKGQKGESFECVILPGTAMSVTNKRGMVNFPYAPSVSSDLTTVSSASNWYTGTPVIEASKISVIANSLVPEFYDVTFRANGGLFDDGAELAVIPVESYTEIVACEAPSKQGYVFAGWSESENGDIVEDFGIMPEQNKEYYAQWVPATDTVYTVEYYNMQTDGTYNLTATEYEGTTNETVNATCSVADGFVLNEEKSVLSGVVAPDGLLVLKVYIDRKTFSFTAVVDGVETVTEYYYGANVIAPATPEKQGYAFNGWDGEIPATMPAEDVVVTANWIAADDVAYTVETYTMQPDGTYSLTTTAHEGTTEETVNATCNVSEGFVLNEEKSVLSGVVAPDGSLVLKVYIDRKTFSFTTVVNGNSTTAEYLYGATVTAPATPSVQGYTFRGWDSEIPATMPAKDVTVTAKFSVAATVSIKNNPVSRTINYGETLRLTAETANMPADAYVKWYVEGSGVSMRQDAENSACDITSTGNGTVTVTAKVVDKNGNPLSNDSGEISDSQTVVSKAGLWQKIVSFFKNLFGSNRTIIQLFKAF